jgi:hypothetical protein
MTNLPEMRFGYQFLDPGPAPRSPRLNVPPSVPRGGDYVAAHNQWRKQVEQEETALARTHFQQEVWFPVHKAGHYRVVPVMGGTPETWDSLVAGLVVAAIDANFGAIRIANLSQWPVLRSLKTIGAKARKARLRFDVISGTGSTMDLFYTATPPELAAFLVDVLRVTADSRGRRDSAREKADLISVAEILDPPISIIKLTAALDVALGAMNPQSAGALSRDEDRAVRDFHHNVVAQRAQTAQRLDGLHADLREISRYGGKPQTSPLTMGSGSVDVRCLEVDGGQAIHELEMSRALTAGAMARAFSRPGQKAELLVVAGADRLATEVLDNLRGSAERLAKQLVLLFEQITPDAQRCLGSGGSDFAAFMRLPNADDAEIAARHFGKEFTFVVNGISIADGQTEEWNTSYSYGTNQSSGRSTQFGAAFGRSVSHSMGTSDNHQTGHGTARNRVTTVSSARTHDFVIQPEDFQHLEDYAILLVENKTATLAKCDYRLRNAPQTSKYALLPR